MVSMQQGRQLGRNVSESIAKLLNMSIGSSLFPESWKSARVTLILKKGVLSLLDKGVLSPRLVYLLREHIRILL